ncbi:MAG: hypothetical protein M3N29_04320 [Chloroflexota bacterium]|nr:hypothetical protein [Chloroflexota bacterium]
MSSRQLLPFVPGFAFLALALLVLVGAAALVRPPRPDLPTPDPTPSREEAEDDDPEAFAAWLTGTRTDEGGLPVNEYLAAEREVRDLIADQAGDDSDRARVLAGLGAAAQPWTWLGPGNSGGRTRAFVVSAADTDVMLAAGITGGIWRSEDAGASWSPITDTFSNIAVGALEIDHGNPATVYAGTGEAYYSDWQWYRGAGIMKSTDGGVSWSFLPSTVENASFRYVGDIEVSPNDPNRVYAATTSGVWVSVDGGQTWGSDPVLALSSEFASRLGPTACLQLEVRSDRSPDVVFASCGHSRSAGGGQVFVSEDAGTAGSWNRVPIARSSGPVGRIALAIAPGNQDVVYASVAAYDDSAEGLYRSERGGAEGTWELRTSPAQGAPDWYDRCGRRPNPQGSYDAVVAVDPTDSDRVWVGGIDLYRSADGGATIQRASVWDLEPQDGTPYTHADQHVIAFHPAYDGTTNRTVYFGNDGGLFVTADDRATISQSGCAISGIAYESMNNRYGVAQFTGGALTSAGDVVVAGTQDNGTWRLDGGGPNDWRQIWGGDGGNSLIAPDGSWVIASYPYFGFHYVTGDFDGFPANEGITDGKNGKFYPPLEMDPNDATVFWTGGAHVWRTTNAAESWTAASGELRGYVSAIAIAPGNGNLVYVGTSFGTLYRSTDALAANPTWQNVDSTGVLPAATVGGIAISPADPNVVLASYQSFTGNQLWRTTTGGEQWYSVDAAIPDVPINTVAFNPRNPQMVYVGSDAGVFESLDGGDTWRVANENLATTIVSRLVFRRDTSELYAFTFGRGAYRVDVGDRAPPPNDLITAAVEVPLEADFNDLVDVRAASSSADDPPLSCGSALLPTQTRSVWYRLMPREPTRLTVRTAGSNYDTVLAVFALAEGDLAEVACNDNALTGGTTSELLLDAQAGSTYYVEVTRSAAAGTDTLANTLVLTISPLR